MNHKDFKIAENSFYNYQRYEETAREDIKIFIENELQDVVVVEANYHNMLELTISGDKYLLYTERGYLVLQEQGNTEFQKMYFESVAECFEFIGIDTKEW